MQAKQLRNAFIQALGQGNGVRVHGNRWARLSQDLVGRNDSMSCRRSEEAEVEMASIFRSTNKEVSHSSQLHPTLRSSQALKVPKPRWRKGTSKAIPHWPLESPSRIGRISCLLDVNQQHQDPQPPSQRAACSRNVARLKAIYRQSFALCVSCLFLCMHTPTHTHTLRLMHSWMDSLERGLHKMKYGGVGNGDDNEGATRHASSRHLWDGSFVPRMPDIKTGMQNEIRWSVKGKVSAPCYVRHKGMT